MHGLDMGDPVVEVRMLWGETGSLALVSDASQQHQQHLEQEWQGHLLGLVPATWFVLDAELNVVAAAGSMGKTLGWDISQIQGLSSVSLVHPDDAELYVR